MVIFEKYIIIRDRKPLRGAIMTLGERITNYRKAKSLSQEDLANILNISRQSVYKWEADKSTPELDKLLAMTSIFEVSLDELIKGEKPVGKEIVVNVDTKHSRHFIAGLVFLIGGIVVTLIMILLSGSILGAVIGLPFIVCAMICFFVRKHTALWCGWTVFTFVDLYMRYATGIIPSHILQSFKWTYEMNYARLAFAWIQFIVILLMIAVSVKSFGISKVEIGKKAVTKTVIAVIVFAVLYVLSGINLLWRFIGEAHPYSIIFSIRKEAYSLLMIAIAIYVVRMIVGMRKSKLNSN